MCGIGAATVTGIENNTTKHNSQQNKRHKANNKTSPIAILLVLGVMDLSVMAVVTIAITVERLAAAGERAARVTGILAIGAGLLLIASAVG